MLETLATLTRKVFGSRNQRMLKQFARTVERINALEPEMQALSDDELAGQTPRLRERATGGESLDELLPEAFAVVREAARRTLDMRHFDVQLIGGMVLHNGKIAEMRTGEGKTLVATLPAYLNSLAGKPVHIVTVNDYLARRDAEWMGKIYTFLGLSVGVIVSGQSGDEKRDAYAADITYGTNNEYGFDYLRDNMAFSARDRVQRGLVFGIVDEVDSILIDEARTPLIISGPTEDSTEMYQAMDKVVPSLRRQEHEDGPGDFSVDEKTRQVYLTDEGNESAEQLLHKAGLLPEDTGLYDAVNIPVLHHLNAALRAHVLFKRDVDYIVRDNQIIIIDEFTGRMMPGRRWSEGLHQAIEAKEGVKVQQENQTLASITFQNYFRMYDKLSGMTGTADTEAAEFQQIYGLEVVVIPTHMPMIRKDMPDQVYRTRDEKFIAVMEAIRECNGRGQPVLVGTTSIETSEHLSGLLRDAGIFHEVLNAKQHEREAHIIAQAGRPGAVTIATNMAGRGTDIVLGGNLEMELAEAGGDESRPATIRAEWQKRHDEVLAAGGLHVIGTERHESRRVDNQLRGRSGRQGDPGSSRFYLSLEDNLLRIFGSERVASLMERMGMEEGEAIEHKWVTRAIENAQRKVEGRNFDIRKQLLEYDDVANEQRKVIYQQRNWLMDAEDISDTITTLRADVVNAVVSQKIPPGSLSEQWDVDGLAEDINREFGLELPIPKWLEDDDEMDEEALRARLVEEVESAYQKKVEDVGAPIMRHLEKAVMLRVLDQQWKDHLASMDYLRHAIGLRGYAQRNPKQEYKREAFDMFEQLLHGMKYEVIAMLQRLRVQQQSEVEALEQRSQPPVQRMQFVHPDAEAAGGEGQVAEPARMAAQGGGAPVRMAAGGHPGVAPPGGKRPVPPPSAAPGSAADPQPFVRNQPKVGRNDPCPCGSGKKYKHCHGKLQ